MERRGLVRKRTLTEAELREIEALAAVCAQHDQIEVRLNWEMLRSRSGHVANDFLYYEDGELIGYLALYSFSRREAEMTGLVHPEHRRQSIFYMLFSLANQELRHRGVPSMLMFFDRESRSGKAFAEAVGARYRNSEYKMELQAHRAPVVQLSEGVCIRAARQDEAALLAHITAVSFEMPEESGLLTDTANDISDPQRATYVTEVAGQVVGEIKYIDGDEAFIYGFCILPEYRGRGYGRETLAWTVTKILQERPRPIALEVATENANALSLYRSCGFEVTRTFDYYEIAVR